MGLLIQHYGLFRDTFYCQLEAGKSPPKKQKKFLCVDKRIFKIVSNYNNRDILTFLRGIAHNLSMTH
jgi:hypothetical protein